MSEHVAQVFGCNQKQAAKTVRRNLQNHFRNVLELIKYPRITPPNISDLLYFDGIDYLDNELKKGKGVILLTAHFGAKQALQIGLGLKGYRVNQINYHMSSEELSWVQKYISQKQRIKIEEQIPVNFIPVNGFMRSAYECLKNNQILIIAGDGIGLKSHMDKSYLPFDFLGAKMLFPTGMASMARRTGAVVIPVFDIRENSKHRIVFEQSINVEHQTDIDSVTEYVRLLEKYVRQHPALWEFWEEFEEGNLIAVSDDSSLNL